MKLNTTSIEEEGVQGVDEKDEVTSVEEQHDELPSKVVVEEMDGEDDGANNNMEGVMEDQTMVDWTSKDDDVIQLDKISEVVEAVTKSIGQATEKDSPRNPPVKV